MKKEKIKRYKKTELLELLIRLRKENDDLRAELEECRKKLEDKHIAIDNAGSIADAAMQLSGIFEAAQAACAQYIENVEAHPGIRIEAGSEEAAEELQQPAEAGSNTAPRDDFERVLAECAELARQE